MVTLVIQLLQRIYDKPVQHHQAYDGGKIQHTGWLYQQKLIGVYGCFGMPCLIKSGLFCVHGHLGQYALSRPVEFQYAVILNMIISSLLAWAQHSILKTAFKPLNKVGCKKHPSILNQARQLKHNFKGFAYKLKWDMHTCLYQLKQTQKVCLFNRGEPRMGGIISNILDSIIHQGVRSISPTDCPLYDPNMEQLLWFPSYRQHCPAYPLITMHHITKWPS